VVFCWLDKNRIKEGLKKEIELTELSVSNEGETGGS
jgi:hypothetical protein